jgi:hypothetical protein
MPPISITSAFDSKALSKNSPTSCSVRLHDNAPMIAHADLIFRHMTDD